MSHNCPNHGFTRKTLARAKHDSEEFRKALAALVSKYQPHAFMASWVVEDDGQVDAGNCASLADGCGRCLIGAVAGAFVETFTADALRAALPVLEMQIAKKERAAAIIDSLPKVGHA